jgi:hypothetical protein
MVLLTRCTQFWQHAFHIVQPDTLLRWHRDLFRRFWRRKSRIASETIALIRKMAKENLCWPKTNICSKASHLGWVVLWGYSD